MRPRELLNVFLVFSLGLLLLAPSVVLSSNGQTSSALGTVCIASLSTDPYSCPPTPAVLTGLAGASAFAAVNIAGSGSFNSFFNAFSIMVKADPSVLNATSFDLSSSVLTNPVVSTACINGKLVAGSFGCSTQDGPGVAHLSASAGCAGVTLACSFASGNLFNVGYKVVGSTNSIPVVFQTGCSGTSNSTSCVTIQFVPANIVCCPPPVPENLQTATFSTTIASNTFSQTLTFDGVTTTTSGSILVNQTTRILTGQVFVRAVNSTTGALIYSNSFNLSLTFYTGSGSLRFILKVPVSSGALASTCQVSFLFGNVLCFMTRTPDLNGNGVVDIVDVGIVFISFGSLKGLPMYNPAADLDGNGIVNIIDAGIIVADFGAHILG